MKASYSYRAISRTPAASRYQRGTALIMSLVILLILTILGVTAMGTATLEERMAGNTQETNKAFQAAESGLNQAMDTAGSLDLNIATTNDFTYSATNASATVTTAFVEFTRPKRGSGHGSNVEAANFDQNSSGSTGAGAKAVIHQGVAQIVPKAN